MKRILALTITLVIVCNSINRLRKNTEQNINIKPSHSCDYCIRAKNLDPSRNNAVDGGNYILCAFEGLTTLGKDGTIVAGTAERWETSDDGLVWTFYIRKDAKWSDGKDVTANDFVYSWRRLVEYLLLQSFCLFIGFCLRINWRF